MAIHKTDTELGWIKRELEAIKRQMREQAAARGLSSSTVTDGQIQSGNYVEDTSGWALFGDGSAEFDALTVRHGLIAPEAITSQVLTQTLGGYSNPMGTADPSITVTFTVPTWATATSVIAMGAVTIETGNIGFIYAKIDGNESAGMLVSDGMSAAVTHQRTWSPSGGSTFDVVLRGHELSSTACNWQLQLSAIAVFTRGV